MPNELDTQEPLLLWKHFKEISRIPRCSKHEEKIREHIISFAREQGLECVEDRVGNVLIRKPPTPGYENAPGVVLQQHMDMVCEKNSDVQHDFSKDPIELDVRGEWLYAKGTTLGADNGLGMAAALGIMEAKDVKHGPLEALFTVDEETGLTGAFALDPAFLQGRIMLNLDSEELGTIYVGCAGGGDTKLSKGYTPIQAPDRWNAMCLTIKGLKGGHSGVDIYEQRGNAVKLLVRILWGLRAEHGAVLVSMSGGDKHNAIPREAKATFFISPEKREVAGWVADREKELKDEYGYMETGLVVHLDAAREDVSGALTPEDTEEVLSLVMSIPHGVLKMSYEIPNLVETSTNLASVGLEGGKMIIHTSSRSSVSSALEAVRNGIAAIGRLADMDVEMEDSYPGWKPDLSSKILAAAKTAYTDLFEGEATVKAIHAGLETGVVGEKYPGMDMISIGPQIEHPHSPDERVQIESCKHFWDLICEILARTK